MRRKNCQTTEAEAWEIVDQSLYGVVSMVDLQGNPYSVPLNLWRDGCCLYFHSAMEGCKIACLRAHPRVSVCFVSEARVIPEAMTTKYASALAVGTAGEVTDPEEKLRAARLLCSRYAVPGDHPDIREGFASCMPRTAIWKITVEEITRKARK